MAAATAIVLGVLVVTNLLNILWLPRAYLITCPVVTALLLVIAKWAGLSWTELGMGLRSIVTGLVWAAVSVVGVALLYGGALALPATRGLVDPEPSARAALFSALVHVPFGTVLLEEVAFRSVLWGLVAHDHGPGVALAVTSVLFGLWHVLPAIHDPDGVQRPGWLSGAWGSVAWVTGTVVLTGVGGAVFGLLRWGSGSVFASMGLHWATNGLGSLFRLFAR